MSNDSGRDKPRDAEDPLGLDDDATDRTAAAGDAPAPPEGPAAPERDTPRSAASSAPPPAAAGARPRGGRLLAALALLLALAAAAAAGYLYYELLYRTDVRSTASDMDGLRERLRATDEQLGRQLQEQAERQQSALEAFRQGLREERAQSDRALRESLAEVARQAPPATSEWQQAEVQYLLRVANHRLLMERDVEGSLRLLRAADGVLSQLDDFSLHEVRARLADEIANLQAVEGTDLQGLFLRLEAAKHDLDRLPLREPSYRREPEPDAPPAAGLWAEIWQQVSGFVRIRRLDSELKPLLAPEEGVYLELNLRLMLERGQLAALRREQMVYEQSLDTAIDWINDYLNVDERPVRTMLEELRALRQINLEQPLPDISGSLNALQQVLRNPA